jgi:hypothetical protein
VLNQILYNFRRFGVDNQGGGGTAHHGGGSRTAQGTSIRWYRSISGPWTMRVIPFGQRTSIDSTRVDDLNPKCKVVGCWPNTVSPVPILSRLDPLFLRKLRDHRQGDSNAQLPAHPFLTETES